MKQATTVQRFNHQGQPVWVEQAPSTVPVTVGGAPVVTETPITSADLAKYPPVVAQAYQTAQVCANAAWWHNVVCVYGAP